MPFRLKWRRIAGISHIAGMHKLLKDHDKLKSKFESEYKHFFDRRTRWLAQHPELHISSPEPLDRQVINPKNVLILSPHPDDEVIGCGGTIAKYVDTDVRVTIIQLTDGSDCAALRNADPVTRTTARLIEAKKVADYLNVSDVRFWKLADGHFNVDTALVEQMSKLLDELTPDIVFLPFINDLHRDHVLTNHLLFKALLKIDPLPSMAICSYETWAVVPCNVFVSTTGFFERKAEALSYYPIPMKVKDYIQLCAMRDAYHHYEITREYGFAENFYFQTPQEFIQTIHDDHP